MKRTAGPEDRLGEVLKYARAREREIRTGRPMPKPYRAVVYVLGCEGYYKIGRGDAKKRLKDLQIGNPFPIKFIGFIEDDYPLRLERALHAEFRPFRVRGEWYKLDGVALETLLSKLCRATHRL